MRGYCTQTSSENLEFACPLLQELQQATPLVASMCLEAVRRCLAPPKPLTAIWERLAYQVLPQLTPLFTAAPYLPKPPPFAA